MAWAEAYLRTKLHLDPYSRLATIDMDRGLYGRKQSLYARKFRMWGLLCPFPWGGELDLHPTQCGRAESYLHAKFHLDPPNRLATVHQRHRQTGQDNGPIA